MTTSAPEISGTWQRLKIAVALLAAFASALGDDGLIGSTITTSPGLTTSAALRGYDPKLPSACRGRAQRIAENGMRPAAPSAKPTIAPSASLRVTIARRQPKSLATAGTRTLARCNVQLPFGSMRATAPR